ncbi:MAG: Ig-like domain-containing protein [Saprospiraceae bacterium]|nr:Ig-like domain-containing protein [Saprospiraceae bacterium]MDW8484133.1 Ig-like domain-containing protein [Saprospiraceae bacterium]
MTRIKHTDLLALLYLLWVGACARPVAPEGGPKDETPPKIVPKKSTPNGALNFKERTIYLTFDEWVTLQDVGTQVFVSPPLAKKPEVVLKGRTLIFRFNENEILRPNTTYTISFGTAIRDLHEGNIAQDLRFVFSTGNHLDSLTITGIAVDAFSAQPVENLSILLYDDLSDSAVVRQRPSYLARTDKSGQFRLMNVRPGTYRCIALEDADQNMRWQPERERIGFLDSLVLARPTDTVVTLPVLRVSASAPAGRLLMRRVNQYGVVRLGYGRLLELPALRADPPSIRWLPTREQDTLLVWYDNPDSIAWVLIADTDTIPIRALSKAAFLRQHRLFFGDERLTPPPGGRRPAQSAASTALPPPRNVSVRLSQPVLVPLNAPLQAIDTSRVILLADSTPTRDFSLLPDPANPLALRLTTKWERGRRYTLSILPYALTDFWKGTNTDTLTRFFTVPTEKQVGTLALIIEGLKPKTAYILQLLNGNTLEEERRFVAETPVRREVFADLVPVSFTAQLIEDANQNGRWDGGDYFARRQPERVFSKKLEALRPGWESEFAFPVPAEAPRQRQK